MRMAAAKTQLRRSQRQPQSCTNCARRKLRCSKIFPCTSCVDRNETESCHREVVHLRSARKASKSRISPPGRQRSDYGSSRKVRHADLELRREESQSASRHVRTNDLEGGENTEVSLMGLAAGHVDGITTLPHIQNEAIVTLEFLSYGRRSILNMGKASTNQHQHSQSNEHQPSDICIALSDTLEELGLSVRSIRSLLVSHTKHLAWMHNVVHMPTFLEQFEQNLASNSWSLSWLALLNALLCSTIHHLDESILQEIGINEPVSPVDRLYNDSIQMLYTAQYMSIHAITSVQTICVLLQVAHNLDQSDFISVLLSAGIRISQCLNLHRLGPDGPEVKHSSALPAAQELIDREVKKRVWWFVVRQDWLQIPFQNTYLIHASQFNTPMPLNCHDDIDRMIDNGRIVVQPESISTESSYTNIVNRDAVIIWKHQSRLCAVGHPGSRKEGVLKLHEQIHWADAQLKKNFCALPSYKKSTGGAVLEVAPYVQYLHSVRMLCMAHKTLTVHRHFQLQSFRDRAFAYTQQSCMAVAQMSVREIERWPPNSVTKMLMKTWTVITHLMTCCMFLAFASIFSADNSLLYDGNEMRRLAKAGREALRAVETHSSIARRGSKLLDVLFEVDTSMPESGGAQISIEDIVRRVSSEDPTWTDVSFASVDPFSTLDLSADMEFWQTIEDIF